MPGVRCIILSVTALGVSPRTWRRVRSLAATGFSESRRFDGRVERESEGTTAVSA
jgi:hypothetical protein